MNWTIETLRRLQKYIEGDGNRYFDVRYLTSNDERGFKVYAMSFPPSHYSIGETVFYLNRSGPDKTKLARHCKPSDFKVYLLKPVDWTESNPNWSEADPKSWDEYQSPHVDDRIIVTYPNDGNRNRHGKVLEVAEVLPNKKEHNRVLRVLLDADKHNPETIAKYNEYYLVKELASEI